MLVSSQQTTTKQHSTSKQQSPKQKSVSKLLVDLRERNVPIAVLGELFNRVYTTLQGLARGQRKRWRGDPPIRTTALVHEAYLKLIGQEAVTWESRSHFFAVAATAMRQILLNDARQKRAQKRGGSVQKLSLEELRETLGREVLRAEERADLLVVLDEALTRLEEVRPRVARMVECRFFGGMTIEETAEVLGVSASTVSRDWKLAQAWLYRQMKQVLEGNAPEGVRPDGQTEST